MFQRGGESWLRRSFHAALRQAHRTTRYPIAAQHRSENLPATALPASSNSPIPNFPLPNFIFFFLKLGSCDILKFTIRPIDSTRAVGTGSGGRLQLSGAYSVTRFAYAVVLLAIPGFAQVQMASNPRLIGTDMAILEAGEVRKDLPCSVTPTKPILGFDLKFHSGYDVSVPLRDLAGSDNLLTVLFRVTTDAHKDEPAYFSQKIRVPSLEEDARGDAYLQGFFDLGEGAYHVDLLMRDRAERVCSFYWDHEASLTGKDKSIGMMIPAGSVSQAEGEDFKNETPIERSSDSPVSIKLLVNFAPQNPHSNALRPADTAALVSILRNLSRQPNIGKFSLTAFNMQEQRVIYRQEGSDKIDFPALGKAVNGVTLGTVNIKQLGQKHGDADFLAELIRSELGGTEHPDAVVFAGPKVMLDSNPSKDALTPESDVQFPVFYMNYNLNPSAVPWQDAIGRAVKMFHGTEYTITRPRELWNSVTEMVNRVVKLKQQARQAAVSAAGQQE